MAFDIFGQHSNADKSLKYDIEVDGSNGIRNYGQRSITINAFDLNSTLAASSIFPKDEYDWYSRFNRYGWVNPYNETSNREYLFFTKPDLNIFVPGSAKYSELKLNSQLSNIPMFVDAANRFRGSLTQLQSSVCDVTNNRSNPFMCLLTNAVTSRLDLPGISSESIDSSSNMYGSVITYRSHSLKSDNGFDFNLSFTDTKYTEIYMLIKLYDEFLRLQKLGVVSPRREYIVNRILSDQFSVYKFIVGNDGESIIYFAKATGVYFSDVPRGDFSDPSQDGFKFSPSFHAQFIEDCNPSILTDFNALTNKIKKTADGTSVDFNIRSDTMSTFDNNLSIVNNKWAGLPYIARVGVGDVRAAKAARENHGNYIYLLKWQN